MRLQPSRCNFFQLSQSASMVLAPLVMLSTTAWAQSPPAAQLNFNKWQKAPASAAQPTGLPLTDVRQANFQAPDAAQLPSLPGPGPATPPDLSPPGLSAPGLSAPGPNFNAPLPSLDQRRDTQFNQPEFQTLQPNSPPPGPQPAPPMPSGSFNQFSNPGGAMAPTHVQPAGGAGLRDAPPAQLPPLNPQASAQPGYRPAVYQNGHATPGYGQPDNGPANPYTYPPVLPPGSMRSPPGPGQAGPGQTGQLSVVANDPRFISPPIRTGNYATTPYRAPLRTISYQVGPQGIVGPLPGQAPATTPQVQPPLTAAWQPQPGGVAHTSPLPQYQPTVAAQLTGYPAGYPAGYQTGYQAGQYCQPAPGVAPGAVVPPTLTPNLAPQMYSPDNAGFTPLFTLGQENYNVLLGRGIIGQPTAYVPGQPIRNFMRYIFP